MPQNYWDERCSSSFIKRLTKLAHPLGTCGWVRRSCAWPHCGRRPRQPVEVRQRGGLDGALRAQRRVILHHFNWFRLWKAVSKELGVSYNVSKLEPKLKPHQFPGFLNGLPTYVTARFVTCQWYCVIFTMQPRLQDDGELARRCEEGGIQSCEVPK